MYFPVNSLWKKDQSVLAEISNIYSSWSNYSAWKKNQSKLLKPDQVGYKQPNQVLCGKISCKLSNGSC